MQIYTKKMSRGSWKASFTRTFDGGRIESSISEIGAIGKLIKAVSEKQPWMKAEGINGNVYGVSEEALRSE